jgi:HEAT repeat protein
MAKKTQTDPRVAGLLHDIAAAQVANDAHAMRTAFDRWSANEDARVGKSLALSLARMEPTPETRYMATRLTQSDEVEVRQLALRALWFMSNAASTEVFAAFIHDDDYRSQLWAIYGLSRIGGPAAQQGILRATQSEDPRVRAEAVKHATLDAAFYSRLLELRGDASRKVRRLVGRRLSEADRSG